MSSTASSFAFSCALSVSNSESVASNHFVCSVTSAIIVVKSGDNEQPDNAHDNPDYVAWTDGNMTVSIWYSKGGTSESVHLIDITDHMNKETVDGWAGRYTKFNRFDIEPDSLEANWEIMIKVTTDSHWNGNVRFAVILHGRYTNI